LTFFKQSPTLLFFGRAMAQLTSCPPAQSVTE